MAERINGRPTTIQRLELDGVNTQDLNAGPVNFQYNVAGRWPVRINSVTIHFSANVNQTVTITRVYAAAAYNTVLQEDVLVAVDEYLWYMDTEYIIGSGLGGLLVQCTNAGVPVVNAFTTISLERYN